MPLQPGSRLGPYEILSALGAGGMGEVYRARDGRLSRDVAIKVLPLELAADPERRGRLLREARAAASLSHPHICTIYDVGEADGHAFVAMEIIDGQSLSARLAARALPPDEVVRYGLQLDERAGARALPRRRASGSEKRQRDADVVRRHQGGRLRVGKAHRRSRDDRDGDACASIADRAGHDRRHAGVHVPRAVPRRTR